MNIRKFAAADTAPLHLKDGAGRLMYTEDGKPMRVHVYGPGSKPYRQAVAERTSRQVARITEGKKNFTSDEITVEHLAFLLAITASFENVKYDGLDGTEMARAIYTDPTLAFIPEQVSAFGGDWANFTPGSATS